MAISMTCQLICLLLNGEYEMSTVSGYDSSKGIIDQTMYQVVDKLGFFEDKINNYSEEVSEALGTISNVQVEPVRNPPKLPELAPDGR